MLRARNMILLSVSKVKPTQILITQNYQQLQYLAHVHAYTQPGDLV